MRVDSVGIYNNRGMVQGKARNLQPRGVAESGKAQSQFAQKVPITRMAENLNRLSSAELKQLSELFGQIDLSALNNAAAKNIDDRPGQFVDIII